MTATLLGLDTSNHNHPNGAAIDWMAVAASGRRFAVIKATEGGPAGFVDPWLVRDRSGAHAAGLAVLLYHFARPGDPAAQARWFLSVVGPLAVGEGIVVDDEDPGITPAWVQAFCDTVYAETTVKPLVYINQTVQNTQPWSAVVADDDGEWLARYDGTTTQPSGGPWGAPAMKQYTDAGQVAGVTGLVDLDCFYGTEQQLLAYGLQGADVALDQNELDMLTWIYQSMTPGRVGIKTDGAGYEVLKWGAWSVLPADEPSARAEGDVHAAVEKLAAAAGASQPLTLDAASAQLLASALAADAGFRAGIVADVVTGITADLAKRFATPPPATTA